MTARWSIVCGLLVVGCGGGLKPSLIDAAYRKPSNVAVYFAVDDNDGEPVADLLASDFNIYEDGKLVSRDESRQSIVNPEVAAVHYTLLLVDMSASVTESDQVDKIVAASTDFAARVEPYQKVAVYAFDGSTNLYEITPFTESETRASQGLSKLSGFMTKDPSTNLHGAIVQALEKLHQALDQAKVPLRFGTLVVFTDGTDRAARVTYQEMLDAIEASDYSMFAIGVGNEIDDTTLSRIGKTGYIRVDNSAELSDGFKQIGDRIVRHTRRYYLLSYCSPARAGKHKVTVEAVSKGQRGELSYDFDAHGFGPGCDATKPPPFDTTGRSLHSRRKMGLVAEPKRRERRASPAAPAPKVEQPAAPAPVEPQPVTAPVTPAVESKSTTP
jgi:VWFA-related protein